MLCCPHSAVAMPPQQTDVCADVALELLKRWLVVSNGTIIEAVRASKTFRSVNKTFRDAFDNDKSGCKLLAKYSRFVLKNEHKCVKGMRRLVLAAIRHRMHTHDANSERRIWMSELATSLERHMAKQTDFVMALKYVLGGTVIGTNGGITNLSVLHRANLPPHHPDHLSRVCNGLPKGVWTLSALGVPIAPCGTAKWAEYVLLRIVPHDQRGSTPLVQNAVRMLTMNARERSPRRPRRNGGGGGLEQVDFETLDLGACMPSTLNIQQF